MDAERRLDVVMAHSLASEPLTAGAAPSARGARAWQARRQDCSDDDSAGPRVTVEAGVREARPYPSRSRLRDRFSDRAQQALVGLRIGDDHAHHAFDVAGHADKGRIQAARDAARQILGFLTLQQDPIPDRVQRSHSRNQGEARVETILFRHCILVDHDVPQRMSRPKSPGEQAARGQSDLKRSGRPWRLGTVRIGVQTAGVHP